VGWVVAILILAVLVAVWLGRSLSTKDDPTGMIGLEAIAEETFSQEGMVFVRGELWRATAERGIVQKGQRVVVTAVRPGLMLVVEGAKSQ
jgi:membrane protein implicated in regulation of membrane protease activity